MAQALEKVRISGPPRLWIRHQSGAKRCPGCHYQILEHAVCTVIDEMGLEGEAMIITGVGCCSRTFLVTDFDAMFVPHGRAPDMATAVKRIRPDLTVFTWQGDGDCISIGTESLIAAANRAEKFTVLMINNANYGTTGGQAAPTTLLGQVTTTTPLARTPDTGYPAHVAELLSGIRGVVYSARTSLHTPANYQKTKGYLRKAFEKQKQGLGLSFVEVISACPVNWHVTPVQALKFIEEKMIAEYPLGEFKNVDKIA